MAVELPLEVSERAGRVRLRLGDFGYAEGETLQDASDELVRQMLVIAMAFRDGVSGRCAPSAGRTSRSSTSSGS
jgi:hypothetical protein